MHIGVLLNCFSPCLLCKRQRLSTNDKMRLTVNLRDDALHPARHPLVLVFFIVPQEQCRQAEVIVFCVNMMWLQPNVCGNRWTVLPWEINSIGVNTDDWDGHCEVGVGQGGNVYVCVYCLCIHTFVSIWIFNMCVFACVPLFLITLHVIDNWGISVIGMIGAKLSNDINTLFRHLPWSIHPPMAVYCEG